MGRLGTYVTCGVLVLLSSAGCVRFNDSDSSAGGTDTSSVDDDSSETALAGFAYSQSRIAFPRPPDGDVAITPLEPNLSGEDLEFTINPALPSGLAIDPATGVISGTPGADTPAVPSFTSYTVTVDNGVDTEDAVIELMITTGHLVDSVADSGDANTATPECDAGGGVCTLRAAVEQAVATGGDQVIFVPSGTYALATPLDIDNTSGLTSLALSGESRDAVVLDGGGAVVPLQVDDVNLEISNLTIEDGFSTLNHGGGFEFTSTVAVTLKMDNVRLRGNHSDLWGGALYVGPNAGAVSITNSVFEDNTSLDGGGAIDTDTANAFVIEDSFFSGNTVGPAESGGAIATSNAADMEITRCRFEDNGNSDTAQGGAFVGRGTFRDSYFEGNTADFGGAIAASFGVSVTIIGSTFTANTAEESGGALYTALGATVTNSTFYRNRARSQAGAILAETGGILTLVSSTVVENDGNYNGLGAGSPGGGIKSVDGMNVRETIIAGNHNNGTASNCENLAAPTSDGYNLTDTAGGDCDLATGTDIQDTLPNIALDTQLRDNGGSVPTLALLASSVAIDADTHAMCGAEDARGVARPRGAACDIGAFEY